MNMALASLYARPDPARFLVGGRKHVMDGAIRLAPADATLSVEGMIIAVLESSGDELTPEEIADAMPDVSVRTIGNRCRWMADQGSIIRRVDKKTRLYRAIGRDKCNS